MTDNRTPLPRDDLAGKEKNEKHFSATAATTLLFSMYRILFLSTIFVNCQILTSNGSRSNLRLIRLIRSETILGRVVILSSSSSRAFKKLSISEQRYLERSAACSLDYLVRFVSSARIERGIVPDLWFLDHL